MSRRKKKGLMHDFHRDHEFPNYDHEGHNGHHNGANKITHTHAKRGWNTGDEPKVCTNCDFAPKDRKQTILVEYEVWKTMMAICATVKVEWQALLKGEIQANGDVKIDGYYIPKQEVTGSSVKNLDIIDDEFISANRIVAGIHSHANMSCFFSSTDVEHTNMSLIKHNIVINNKSEYKAQSRTELPCGLVKFIDAEVFTVGSPTLVVTGIENIKERVFGFKVGEWNTNKENPGTIITLTKQDGKVGDAPVPETLKDGTIDGLRFCPCCSTIPEEDSGVACTCWTKGKRAMLPDFTEENYEKRKYGTKSYELKWPLALKYQDY